MSAEAGMPRREFLSRSAKVAAAATVAPYLPAGQPRADGGRGELGLVGADHVGITVPDINQAIEWFEDVMGAVAPLTFGPLSDPTGTFMHDLLDVDPRAVIPQITVLRIGRRRCNSRDCDAALVPLPQFRCQARCRCPLR